MPIIQSQLGSQARTMFARSPLLRPQSKIISPYPRYRRFILPGAVTGGDLVICKPSNPAIDFTTQNIGGSKTAIVVNGVLNNEILFKMASNSTGFDSIQYAKAFLCNHSPTGQALDIYAWLLNSGAQLTALDYPSIVPTGPGETYPKFIRWVGFIAGPTPQQSDMNFNMNLTDQVYCVEQFLTLTRATLHNQADGSIVPADYDIQVWGNGVQKGVIPQGYSSCNFDFEIGIGNAANDSQTIALASDAPAGVIFSNSNGPWTSTFDFSLFDEAQFDGSVIIPYLTPGDGWPLWFKWDLPNNVNGTKLIDIVLAISADDGGSG